MEAMSYVRKTLGYMQQLGIPVRDTWDEDFNWDDWYSNGGIDDGPRHFDIEWGAAGEHAHSAPGKKYMVPEHEGLAWDSYRIKIPRRYVEAGRDDPIIHECVHFLQQISFSEYRAYVRYNGRNMLDYLTQRIEVEAHLVQLAYIVNECPKYLEQCLDSRNRNRVFDLMAAYQDNPDIDLAILLIMEGRNDSLI